MVYFSDAFMNYDRFANHAKITVFDEWALNVFKPTRQKQFETEKEAT